MQFALRLVSKSYNNFVYGTELLSEYFSFIESGVPLENFDYFKLARVCKGIVCKFGIKATKNCDNYTNNGDIIFTKYGFTKTMVHTMFDEIPNDIAR